MRCSDVLLCGSKSWVEGAGCLASLLVFATFCMKTMLQLTITAILSNVAFIACLGLLDIAIDGPESDHSGLSSDTHRDRC
ncbi:hypothetical protein SAMN05192541_12197 [Bradyrhizobium arachidis]|nr:hypothetical protein SAMN05192541_12197 [Bradyrhizobium arachidis]